MCVRDGGKENEEKEKEGRQKDREIGGKRDSE